MKRKSVKQKNRKRVTGRKRDADAEAASVEVTGTSTWNGAKYVLRGLAMRVIRSDVDTLAWIPTLAERVNTTHTPAQVERSPNSNLRRRPPHQGIETFVLAKPASRSNGL